ncbi:MAG: hypothetical protein OEQ47_10790, partial [Acidimicrobiia bacterium]|nr:hypothetical protein [Acidimicrobiia bacterium]
MNRARRAAVASLAMIVIACGGGDDTGIDDLGGEVFEGVGQASGDVGSTGAEPSSSADVGPVTHTADPSTGWVEVDGQRYEFAAVGSVNYRCEVLEDSITINFQQTASGHDLTLQGRVLDGAWNASITFAPEGSTQIAYGASVGFDPGTLGLGNGELSYEGSMNRIEDYDAANLEQVQATLAVNCADPGDGTTADIAGESFEFPFSGANSLSCSIVGNSVEVLIGHSQPEFSQLQVDVREEGDGVFGAVILTVGDMTYSSFVREDGGGLGIAGQTMTYAGAFTTQ